MAASTELKPRDVVNALQTLEDNQLKELFYHLEVPLPTLNNICVQNTGKMRGINYVETWFNNDMKASWEKIVAGLEHIHMNALAHKLALKYGLRRDATSVSIRPSLDLTASPVTAPVATDIQTTASLLTAVAIIPPSSLTTSPPSAASVPTTAHSVAPMAITTPSSLSASFPVTAPTTMDPQPATLSLTPSSSSGLSLISAAVADDQQHTPPGQPLVSSVACPTPTSDRVSQVKADIDQLENTFADLMLATLLELCTKESRDPIFLKQFRFLLLSLPVAKKAIHTKFFHESEDEFLKAANMEKIFAILTRYCNYRNYEIIQHVVKKFCEAMLRWKMQQYCQALESFEKATTVDIYLLAISACQELSLAFTQMTMKINKAPSTCTLHETRKVNEAIAEGASLQPYAVYIESVTRSSVLVAVQFPSSCLGWVLAALTPDFLHAHLLSDVAIGGEKITSQQRSQEKLKKVTAVAAEESSDDEDNETESGKENGAAEESSSDEEEDSEEDENEELITASEAGDVVRVVSLLNSGADINTVGGRYSRTALDYASWKGQLQVVRLLLHRGAEVECRDRYGWTPLISAATYGKCDVVIDLLDSGADVNAQDNDGDSALMRAAYWGRTEIVKELIKAKASLDLQNKTGYSALMIAASDGYTETVAELVQAKANLDLQSNNGDSALMRAAYCGHTETVEELVKAKANLDLQNNDGDSALVRAAYWGHTAIVAELVKAKANLDLQNNDGDSALMRAGGRTEIVKELIKAKASLDLQNKDGDSALMIAAYWGHTETVEELVKAKANLDLQNNRGDSAVIQATVVHQSDVLRVLVGAGSDLNLQNEEGLTALMIAARSWSSDITDILLEGEHIDLDIQENSTGWSALFFSAERGDVATTQSLVLLTAGANVHLKDKNGLTALEVARASEQDTDEVCELLTQTSAIPHSHPCQVTETDRDSSDHEQDSSTAHQDITTAVQDSSPTEQESTISHQDTHSPEMDSSRSAASDQIISTSGQRRRRRRVPQVTEALRNLANMSGQRIQQIFNQLDRRLKSADKKTQSGVRSQGRDRGQKTKRPPDNQTTSTTDTRTVNV